MNHVQRNQALHLIGSLFGGGRSAGAGAQSQGAASSLNTAGPSRGSRYNDLDDEAPSESGFHRKVGVSLGETKDLSAEMKSAIRDLTYDMEILGRACQGVEPRQGMYYAAKQIPNTANELEVTHTRPRDTAGYCEDENLVSFNGFGAYQGRRLFVSHYTERGDIEEDHFTILMMSDSGSITPVLSSRRYDRGYDRRSATIAVAPGESAEGLLAQARVAIDGGLVTTLQSGALYPGLADFFSRRLMKNPAVAPLLKKPTT